MQMGLREENPLEREKDVLDELGNPFQLISVFIDLRQEAIKFTFRNINMTMRCRMLLSSEGFAAQRNEALLTVAAQFANRSMDRTIDRLTNLSTLSLLECRRDEPNGRQLSRRTAEIRNERAR